MAKFVVLAGGFHNSPAIRLRVPERAYNAAISGEYRVKEWVNDYCTPSQQKRLQAHFCGISGCLCGGVVRAEFVK